MGQATVKQVVGSWLMPTVHLRCPSVQVLECPHLVHADIISKGALNHWGIVIDVQNGHLKDVGLLPWRGAPVRCHDLGGRGDGSELKGGLGPGIWSPIYSVGRLGG